MKKGKQREIPKAKKPTSLKKVCGHFPWKQDTGRLMHSAYLPATLSPSVFSVVLGNEAKGISYVGSIPPLS
jgi:hypothetical protein